MKGKARKGKTLCEVFMNKPKNSFALRLRNRRGQRTYAQAADDIGISVRTYENWEQGRYVPDRLKQDAALMRLSVQFMGKGVQPTEVKPWEVKP